MVNNIIAREQAQTWQEITIGKLAFPAVTRSCVENARRDTHALQFTE